MTGIRWGDWIQPGDLVVDVGANAGDYTKAFSRAGAQVIAFEPDADVAEKCRSVCPAADVRVAAVADTDGEASFYRASPNTQSSRHVENVKASIPITVPQVALDTALRGMSIAGIKIDAQGDDGWVVLGAQQTLARMRRGAWIVMELWPAGMRAAGFDIGRLVPLLNGWRVVASGKAYAETTKTLADIVTAIRDYTDGRHTNVLLRKV